MPCATFGARCLRGTLRAALTMRDLTVSLDSEHGVVLKVSHTPASARSRYSATDNIERLLCKTFRQLVIAGFFTTTVSHTKRLG